MEAAMPVRVSMRWWLAGAFALIAAVTAIAVAQFFSQRSEDAFRERAQELAAGNAVQAAIAIAEASGRGALEAEIRPIAEHHRLALFVYDGEGRLLTARTSRGVGLAAVPHRTAALRRALGGRRFISTDGLETTIVALPLRAGGSAALLAYASHPDLAAELGIVREEVVAAAAWAIALGGLVGVFVAILIAVRLRRITAAARAIEAGRFTTPLEPRLQDEVGELAATVGRMGQRLGESFSRLESEREGLRRLLERLHQGVVTVDRELRIEFANSEAHWLLGVEGLQEGTPLPETWEGFSLRRFSQGLFGQYPPASEERVRVGDQRTFSVVGIAPHSPKQGAILVITDISARERRERAEREFVANAAHELRTPLTTIRGAVEALQAGAKDVSQERERFLSHIDRESTRLGRLVRALLVLARAQTNQEGLRRQPVELAPLLEEIAARVETKPGVEVGLRCPPGLAILADRDLVEEVFSNLVENAARYTSAGEIMTAASAGPDGTVLVEVADTGPGIAPEERLRVFDRFYRGDRRGTEGFGLGLAIVRQAVAALDGTIEIESAPGIGTIARVTLPAAAARSERVA
jgi:two-component system, OmpR family, sensor histidine kinase ResE